MLSGLGHLALTWHILRFQRRSCERSREERYVLVGVLRSMTGAAALPVEYLALLRTFVPAINPRQSRVLTFLRESATLTERQESHLLLLFHLQLHSIFFLPCA